MARALYTANPGVSEAKRSRKMDEIMVSLTDVLLAWEDRPNPEAYRRTAEFQEALIRVLALDVVA